MLTYLAELGHKPAPMGRGKVRKMKLVGLLIAVLAFMAPVTAYADQPRLNLNNWDNPPIELTGGGVWSAGFYEARCVTFHNKCTKTAVAVEIMFRSYNAFYDFVSQEPDQGIGAYAPGGEVTYPTPSYALIKGNRNYWHSVIIADNPMGMLAYATRVRFDDGTEWTRPDSAILTKMLH